MRHFLERGTRDADGQRHSAKFAWRALALLQIEIEQEQVRSIKVSVDPRDKYDDCERYIAPRGLY
jgi:hypothetical protein